MDQGSAYHFILIEDSKLDSYIGQIIITRLGPVCLSFKSFLDPQEALVYVQNREITPEKTIIFLDIQMPLMTGFEFIEQYEILVPPEKQANYIINILSSSINEKDMIQAKSYKSVNAYLNKPMKKEMIDAVLDTLKWKF